MNGKRRREKGAEGEREFFKELSKALGWEVKRNLGAARDGGSDGDLESWAIEVKRQECGFQQAWWDQAVAQAKDKGAIPVLAYRRNRQPWRVRIPIAALTLWAKPVVWLETDIAGFAAIVKGPA